MKDNNRNDNLGYFKIWPAPMFEALCRLNPAEAINATTPFYGPMLYSLTRAIGAQFALEIGNDRGWCSGFMAYAIKENALRLGHGGRFYGIDISDKSQLQAEHDDAMLPSTFIQDEKGSVHWLENQKILGNETLDIAFVDGLHQDAYVQREVELLYPLIKSNGSGYICLHDVYSTCENAFPKIVSDPRYKWEYIRLPLNYGFAILRKMEGYDHTKRQWPEGDETALGVAMGLVNEDGTLK